jgi:wobble nucleotide-excising tRNase
MAIKSIDLTKFGSFENFSWTKSVRDNGSAVEFKRLNVLYGRNYSGKTTLSRVVRALQTKELPSNFSPCKFSLVDDGITYSESNFTNLPHEVRVYNTDFVNSNLSFLTDHTNGEIKTFAIIGSKNLELEKEISENEGILGNGVDAGLRAQYLKRNNEAKQQRTAFNQATARQDEQLRRHANDVIKKDRDFGSPGYNLKTIQSDIEWIAKNALAEIFPEGKLKLEATLRDSPLPDVTATFSVFSQLENIVKESVPLFSRTVVPTMAIQDLVNDSLLQAWVKAGIDIHKDKRNTCGFCDQPIPPALWSKLDAHFSKEASKLELELDSLIGKIEGAINQSHLLPQIDPANLYQTFRDDYSDSMRALASTIDVYHTNLKNIADAARARKQNIFKTVAMPIIEALPDLATRTEKINSIIRENNLRTTKLSSEQTTARNILRLHSVKKFIEDIQLARTKSANGKLETAAIKHEAEVVLLQKSVLDLENRNEKLKIQQKDEKKGAEKINEILNHFFGHQGLRLVANENPETNKFSFQIFRGEQPAFNLSEGECSLISFCYFVARLSDAESKGKDLIIYIDDPICSLDSNHVFFVFSLIESMITKPTKAPDGSNIYGYQQLFISTHNLDFLKYLKRLSVPRRKEERNGKNVSVEDNAYFLVEGGSAGSSLALMPKYLREYTTEFNYLFHQIHKCSNPENAKDNHESFYSFGNNLRKFLEAYLFYRYPFYDNKNDSLEKLTKFFGDDATAIALINRVSNELSHLEEVFDRSMIPIDIPEISTLSNFVLDTMFTKDSDQFNALLKSIGLPPRLHEGPASEPEVAEDEASEAK